MLKETNTEAEIETAKSSDQLKKTKTKPVAKADVTENNVFGGLEEF